MSKRSKPDVDFHNESAAIGMACALVLHKAGGQLPRDELVGRIEQQLGRAAGDLSKYAEQIEQVASSFFDVSSAAASSQSVESASVEQPSKKARTADDAGAPAAGALGTTADSWLIAKGKMVAVKKYPRSARFGVDLRSYRDDKNTGQPVAGSGIFLQPEQWALLAANIDKIDQLLDRP